MTDPAPDKPTPELEDPPEPPRDTPPKSSGGPFQLRPTPEVRRIGKTALLLAMVGAFMVMTLLSFRYSRQAASRQQEEPGASLLTEPPLDPSQIERFEPDALPGSSENRGNLLQKLLEAQKAQEETSSSSPPSPPPRVPHKPNRADRSMAAPLAAEHPRRRATGGQVSDRQQASPSDLLADELRGLPLSVPEPEQPPPPEPDPRVIARPDRGDAETPTVSPAPAAPMLFEGTVLPAVLTRALKSDLAGPVRAVISRDVYDSLLLKTLLIPRGTVALGRQDRQPLFGESRLLILWHRLLLPDGRSIDLSGAPAAGQDGALGLPGDVNRHWGRRFATVGLLSLAGAGVQLSQPQRSASGFNSPDAGQLAAGELGLQIGRLSQQILRQALDVPPTVSLQAGSRLGILVTRDLTFPNP